MNILAIGAHPDDIEFGCGGSLAYLSSKNHKINLFVLTKGEIGGSGEVRKKEQENSSKLLNAKIFWSKFSDTKIPFEKDLIDAIESIIKITKPDLIFSHFPLDSHQDHQRVGQAVITAARYSRNVLFYEVPTTTGDFTPDIFVNIGKFLEKKMQLLKAHKSQVYATRVAGLSILETAKACATFRGFQARVKFAEGFKPLRFALENFL